MPTPSLSDKDLQTIWTRIETARNWQKKTFVEKIYTPSLRIYAGDHWLETEQPDALVVDNKLPVIVRTRVEATSFSTPEFTVRPLDRQGEANQFRAKAALRYYWHCSPIMRELRRASYWREICGLGCVQLGWLFRTKTVEITEGRLPVQGESPDSTPDEYASQKPVSRDEVIEDKFTVVAIDPQDLIVPSCATPILEELPFMALRQWKKLDAIKRDKRYKAGVVRDLKGTTKPVDPYLPDTVRDMKAEDRPSDCKDVETVIYYETERGLKVTFAVESGKALLVEALNTPNGGYPFLTTHSAEGHPNQFYRKSLPLALYDSQQTINQVTTRLNIHLRQFDRLFTAPADTLDEKAIHDLAEGRAGSVILHNGPAGSQPIQLIPYPQLPTDLYNAHQGALDSMIFRSGLSQYQFARVPSKRMTADESRAVQQAGGVMFYADAQEFVGLCEKTAQALLEWSMQYSAVTREIPVLDDGDNPATWTDFSREQIKGSYMVEIAVESTAPPNKADQLQDAQLSAQTLLQAAQLANPQTGEMPKPVAIVFRLLLRLLGEKHVDELIADPNRTPPALPPALPPAAALGPALPALPQPAYAGPPSGPGPEALPPVTDYPPAPGGDPVAELFASLPPGLVAQLLGVTGPQ